MRIQQSHQAHKLYSDKAQLFARLEHYFQQKDYNLIDCPVALVCLKIHGLRSVQNVFGLSRVEMLLQQIAQKISAIVGQATQPIIPLTKLDEFVFILTLTTHSIELMVKLTSLIHQAFAKPFEESAFFFELSASMGIALRNDEQESIQTLINNAFKANTIAKKRHLDFYIFNGSKDPDDMRRLKLLSDFRPAFANGAMHLVYQPQLCLINNKVEGLEALIRWHHPVYGQVSPEELVAIAEKTGLIQFLTRSVIDQVMLNLSELVQLNLPIKTSINVSAFNLIEPNFADYLISNLQHYSINPALVCVEVTETAVLIEPKRVHATIHKLEQQGVKFAIDDFGTGHSSFANLKRLKIAQIKIDRQFIKNLTQPTEDEAIVRATLEMADCLGIEVVAEGVDHVDIFHKLQHMCCNLVQGFFIAEPMPFKQLIKWLKAQT